MDNKNNRSLASYNEYSDGMTIGKCLSVCRAKGFPYSGLEWQSECYCGYEPRNGFKWAWPSKCDEKKSFYLP